jgi:hypothetical protein
MVQLKTADWIFWKIGRKQRTVLLACGLAFSHGLF